MNKTKRFLCLLLSTLMFLPSFAACADRDENDDKPAVSGTNTEDPEAPVFPNADYEDKEFRILYNGETEGDYVDAYIWADDVTGGAIGDAVAERNRLVEERYSVILVAEACDPMGEATKRQQAGQCDFSLIYDCGGDLITASLDRQLYDFLDVPNINLDASYWVPWAVDELTVCNNLFVATNYITMNSFSWANMLFFNKKLMDKLNYEYPYKHVDENTWLVDTYIDMLIGAEEDLNGDGIMNFEDQYGAFADSPDVYRGLEKWYEMDGDGNYTVIGYTEEMVSRYNKYKNILDRCSVIGYGDVWDDVDKAGAESEHIAVRNAIFCEDHAMFMGGNIDMTRELVNMQSEYGVCPQPKYAPEDDYRHVVDTTAPMFGLPLQLEDPDMTGIILEYMAYESEQHLLPAYYDTTLKTKRMSDTHDYDMLDIIRTSITYGGGLKVYGGCGVDRSSMFISGNFASVWKRQQNKAQAQLNDTIALLEDLDW